MQFLSRLFSRFVSGSTAANGGARAASARQKSVADGHSSLSDASSYEDSTPLNAQADRTLRREQLYDTVRECMMRIGVLSTSYKFKVLALDSRGRQFLVMMDLAQHALSRDRWNETEALITQTVQARLDTTVKAVYWRINPQITEVLATAHVSGAGLGLNHVPPPSSPHWQDVPVSERPTRPAALDEFVPRGRLAARRAPAAPVEADEVAAFNRALAQAHHGDEPPRAKPVRRSVWQNKSALAGFEDTRLLLPDPEPGHGPGIALGPTQFGGLH